MATSRRMFRIAEQIRMVLATELLQLADQRFFMVTITSVVVSSDLRNAKIYWVVNGNKDQRVPEVEQAFISAVSRLQRMVSKLLGMRFSPQLRFYYDDTLDTRDQVQELMSRVAKQAAGDLVLEPEIDGDPNL